MYIVHVLPNIPNLYGGDYDQHEGHPPHSSVIVPSHTSIAVQGVSIAAQDVHTASRSSVVSACAYDLYCMRLLPHMHVQGACIVFLFVILVRAS